MNTERLFGYPYIRLTAPIPKSDAIFFPIAVLISVRMLFSSLVEAKKKFEEMFGNKCRRCPIVRIISEQTVNTWSNCDPTEVAYSKWCLYCMPSPACSAQAIVALQLIPGLVSSLALTRGRPIMIFQHRYRLLEDQKSRYRLIG